MGVVQVALKMATETKVLTKFTSKLVTAICDCVQSVAEKCHSRGIVPDSVYTSVITTGGQTNKDKARVLVEAVKNSVGVDTTGSCFQLFLNVLDEELPYAVKGSLLVPLKEEVSKTSQECQSVVPFHVRHSAQSMALITNDEMVRQQTSFFGRLEDAIRKHERVCSEKAQLEENIKVKEQENWELKAELNSLTRVDGAKSIEQLENTVSRIAACEADVSELREKVKELQSIIEEQSMLIKRGKSTMKQGLITFSAVAENKIRSAKESVETKESVYKVQLLEAERKIRSAEESAKKRETEYKVRLLEAENEIRSVRESAEKREIASKVRLLEAEKELEVKKRMVEEEKRMAEEIKRRVLEQEVALKNENLQLETIVHERKSQIKELEYQQRSLADILPVYPGEQVSTEQFRLAKIQPG